MLCPFDASYAPSVVIFNDSSNAKTSFVKIPLTGVLMDVFFPRERIAPFNCLISVMLPLSISWSIEDLLALVDNRILRQTCLGFPTSLIPAARLTNIPSSITLRAISWIAAFFTSTPLGNLVKAESGFIAALTMAFAHSTPRMFELVFVENPAALNAMLMLEALPEFLGCRAPM